MNEQTQDIQVESLSEKVKDFRKKAREILRMERINLLLQNKNNVTRDRDYEAENLNYAKKQLARTNYRLSKLDLEDPDYDEKLKAEERTKAMDEATLEDTEINNARNEVHHAKKETEIDEAIAKWESGENKVSIESIESLAGQMIRKI